jgi:hypothetical protein
MLKKHKEKTRGEYASQEARVHAALADEAWLIRRVEHDIF